MQDVIPETKMPEPSRAGLLIADTRSVFRTGSIDQTALKLLLNDLKDEYAGLIARFEKSQPDWKSSSPPDSLRSAAEATLRICMKALMLRMTCLDVPRSTISPIDAVSRIFFSLDSIAGEIEFHLLTTTSLVNAPSGLSGSDRKRLMLERAAHQIQVDAYCCFLLDLKQFCPISVETVGAGLLAINSTAGAMQSVRRNPPNPYALLSEMSHLRSDLFVDGLSATGRCGISSEILKRSTPAADLWIGNWDWFDNDASDVCRHFLSNYNSAAVSNLPTALPTCKRATVLCDETPTASSVAQVDVDQVKNLHDLTSLEFADNPNAVADEVQEAPATPFRPSLDPIEEQRRLRMQVASSASIPRRTQKSFDALPPAQARIRAIWRQQFKPYCDSANLLDALSLAVHPWPDHALPDGMIEEIAAELLPVCNLSHHNLFQVCADRLSRLAAVFDARLCPELEFEYSSAANVLAEAAPVGCITLSDRVWSESMRTLTLSPTGLGGILSNQDAAPDDSATIEPPERLSEALTHLAGVAARNRSFDIGMIGGGEATGVTIGRLAGLMGITLPIEAFDKYLSSLDSRRRGVLIRRKLAMKAMRTLDEVGNDWGVTRERIRQIESNAFEAIDRLFRTRFQRFGAPAFAEAIMHVLPTDELHELAKSVCGTSCWQEPAAAFMLHALGPWTGTAGWSVHESLECRIDGLPQRLTVIADKHGLIATDAVLELCSGLFRSDADREIYLKSCIGLGHACGQWTIKNTYRCRIAAALVHLGTPATKVEIAALANMTPDQTGSTLAMMDGIVRADRFRWGFSEWIDDEYDGIAGEIIQRIEAHGGMVRAAVLLSEIPELFDVSENSVRAYLASDAFVVQDGLVRRADAEEFLPSDVRSIKDAVFVNGNWGHRIRLYQRHFEGYSLGVSFDIA